MGEVQEAIEGIEMLPVGEFLTRESTKRLAVWPREKGMMLEMVVEQKSRMMRECGSQCRTSQKVRGQRGGS